MKRAPARVEVAVRGKKGTYAVRAEQYPLSVTVQLGDAAAGAAGLCGEGTFIQ